MLRHELCPLGANGGTGCVSLGSWCGSAGDRERQAARGELTHKPSRPLLLLGGDARPYRVAIAHDFFSAGLLR